MATADASITNALRFLTLRHAQTIRNERLGLKPLPQTVDTTEDIPQLEHLKDGHQKLYSYFRSGLDGGNHNVSVVQNIKADGKTLGPKQTPKVFRVEAPQYRLPDGCVHSVSPAEGERAPAETLPHIVFNDAHVPWERKLNGVDDDEKERERVPWLALLVFSQEEIRIAPQDLTGDGGMLADTQLAKDAVAAGRPLQQSPTLSLPLKWSDIDTIKKKGVASPIPQPDQDTSMDVVFLRPGLFNKLITTYENGEPKKNQTTADASRYKYLAHVRHVKTAGMAASARYEKGLFSVILSHRLGPIDATNESSAVAHLVSLEGWSSMSLLDEASVKYVALTSLHSWTYTAMPTGGFNLSTAFKNLGASADLLRVPYSRVSGLTQRTDRASMKLSRRLYNGYTMVRSRTQTGEETAAFLRGALVPCVPDHPLTPAWNAMSNSGTDLQILDQETGMLDLTYSTAWNLGKTMALADQAFTTSLSRLRNRIHAWSLNEAKRKELATNKAFKSREQVVTSLAKALAALNNLSKDAPEDVPEARWKTDFSATTVDLRTDNPEIHAAMEDSATYQARKIAGSTVKDKDGNIVEIGKALFNELNTPFSTDWMIVVSWIMDRMYLFGIPPHHLVADPSFLPQESIRFFHIDPNWIDCFIDGALSLANQISQTDDFIRRALKGAINAYMETVNPEIGYRPQVPSHGFLVRSDLVKQYPDLRVEAPFPEGGGQERKSAPLLRHEIIGDGILLCLLDRAPTGAEMPILTFKQPPHQQTFAVGNAVSPTQLRLTWKRAYSRPSDKYAFGDLGYGEKVFDPASKDTPFLWGENNEARFLLLDAWAAKLRGDLSAPAPMGMGDDFQDETVTSALTGFQLGAPIYELSIRSDEELSKRLAPLASDPTVARRLKMLQKKITVPAAAAATFQAREAIFSRMAAAAPLALPLELPLLQGLPHHRAPPPPPARESPPAGQHETAGAPTFSYAVLPSDGLSTRVPSGGGTPQDLVFKIVRTRGEAAALQDSNYDLRQIVLRVPRGRKARDSESATLLEGYAGPGATMLSNLRFNVLVESGDGFLQMRVVPRSRTGKVALGKVAECSFLLGLVDVHGYDWKRFVAVTGTEHYVRRKPREVAVWKAIPGDVRVTLEPEKRDG